MIKYIDVPNNPYFFSRSLNKEGIVKTADLNKEENIDKTILDFIKNVIPSKKDNQHVYVLATAVGSGEIWGDNKNKDFFFEKDLFPPDNSDEYGYKTFVSVGNPFRHHQNSDPNKTLGKVEISEFNPIMHRVELIIRVDKDKCDKWNHSDLFSKLVEGKGHGLSMGCFKIGTKVIMADGTKKEIEKIQIGDEVLTHMGRARKVTSIFKRQYKDLIYSIKVQGCPIIQCTKEHPFLIMEKENKKNGWADLKKESEKWVHAECLKSNFVCMQPVFSETKNFPYLTKEFARLFGYYMAEGSLIKNAKKEIKGLVLTTNKNDYIHQEIDILCEKLNTKNKPVKRIHHNSEQAIVIELYDKNIANEFFRLGSSLAKEKKLLKEVLEWPIEFLKEFIGTYCNGDGHFTKKGLLTISTASNFLASQFSHLLGKIGLTTSIALLKHKAGKGFNKHETLEYVITIGANQAQQLKSYCQKIKEYTPKSLIKSKLILNNKILIPIEGISKEYEECEVFNLEVEDDNSYLVENIAVHNCKLLHDLCSICLNPAKTKKDYCEHINKMLGQIMPDGRKVVMINPKPKFFDISFVEVPAWEPAHIIRKIDNIEEYKKEKTAQNIILNNYVEKTAAEKKVKDKIEYNGLEIFIENPIGTVRRGKDWATKMKAHYGRIPNTKGHDGEALDIYLLEKPSDKVFIVKQVKNGKFDEEKIMLGFSSKEEAKQMYLEHIPEKFFGGIAEIPFNKFKEKFNLKNITNITEKLSMIYKNIPSSIISSGQSNKELTKTLKNNSHKTTDQTK